MRKLATAGLAFAAGTAAAHYLLPAAWRYPCALALALLALPALLLRGRARLRALLCLLCAAAGLGWYGLYAQRVLAPAEALAGQERTVLARVAEAPQRHDDWARVLLRLAEPGLPAATVQADDYDGHLDGDLRPGDLVRLTLRFRSAASRYGEETDIYASRGIALRAYVEGAPARVDAGVPLSYLPARLAAGVSETAGRVFPADVTAFVRALLVGDTAGLYEDYRLEGALSTAGLRHVVAVSGMHLSFLYAAVVFLAGRRRAARFGLPAVWVYAMLVGLTPSVVRAAVMLSLVMAAPLLRREADGPTSLAAALLLLLLANPVAIAAAGLQLSFAAMAGILLVSTPLHGWLTARLPGRGRLRRFLAASLAGSAGALVFTTPLTALLFGYVSLVAPLANLLALWAVSLGFLAGWAAVLLGAVWTPLGVAAAWLAAWPLRWIRLVAGALAALPYAAVYTANRLVPWWLAFSYGVFGLAWLLRGKGRFRPLAPALASALALAAVVAAASIYANGAHSLTVLDVGQGQCVLLLAGGQGAVVDCGGGSIPENAGDRAAAQLLAAGRRKLDLLVLTHLHADHANGAARLLSRLRVSRLLLPADAEDPDGLLPGILAEAARQGTEVGYVTEDLRLDCPGLALRLFAPIEAGDANERGVIVLASFGDWDALITGDVDATVERRLVERAALPDCELLVVGHHGSRYSTSFELLEALRAETAVVSVGYNSYGHPTWDALSRLALAEMEVFRTDLDGTVTVRMERDG